MHEHDRDTLTRRLSQGSPYQREMALETIGALGPAAAAWAVPLLSSALHGDIAPSEDGSDWSGTQVKDASRALRRGAAAALARMGRSGVEVLRRALSSDDEHLRTDVAWSLDRADADTLEQLAPELRQALEHRAGELRAHALSALARIEPPPPWLFVWLSTHHDDRHASVRSAIARALGAHGIPALPILRSMMDDRDSGVQSEAAHSFAAAAPAERALLELLALLRAGPEPGFSRWMAAIEGLAALGPAAAEALPLLEAHLRGADRHLKHDLMAAIERISGPPRR